MYISLFKENGSLRKVVEKAVDIYNKTRSPEAMAKIIEIDEHDHIVKIEFTGYFCFTCGVRDWVEDLVYIIEQLGHRALLIEYVEPDNDVNKRIGIFKVNTQ
ncbi:MAG: hypothetical protein QW254_05500 [Desulfurococcaceae archaeon]